MKQTIKHFFIFLKNLPVGPMEISFDVANKQYTQRPTNAVLIDDIIFFEKIKIILIFVLINYELKYYISSKRSLTINHIEGEVRQFLRN